MGGVYVKTGRFPGVSWYEGHLMLVESSMNHLDKDRTIEMLAGDVADLVKRVRGLEKK